MSDEFVIFNGVKMHPDWPKNIKEAQEKSVYVINGKEYQRIRYGDEMDDWGADHPCHDCAVIKGQYHVAYVCDVERCPVCDGQVMACGCDYEGDEEI